MNGFSSGLLSILLGWLQTLLTNLWRLLDSEGGSSFVSFITANWPILFVICCIGGFVIDRIIYFFRWRPDYVWRTKWARLRQKNDETIAEQYMPLAAQTPPPQAKVFYPEPDNPPFPQATTIMDEFHFEQPAPAHFHSDGFTQASPVSMPVQTFAPQAQYHQNLTPQSIQQPTGVDVLSSPSPQTTSPIHPGIDLQTFHQNIGLADSTLLRDTFEAAPQEEPLVDFPDTTYVPYYKEANATDHKRKGGLFSFAKKARDFVTLDDERPPSIRDMHAQVDMRSAFHPPVLPQQYNEGGED